MTYPRPMALLAELTHACPLHCPYCSNPLSVSAPPNGLSADEWVDTIAQAAELGVLQCSFSGGEPLLHPHLERLVGSARHEGLYTNLITSGVSLTRPRAERLKAAGLDNAQISFQADTAERADSIAGARVHELKLEAARSVRNAGLNLSVNVVLHRFSIDRLSQMVELAADLGASRIELAHVQFYGWAFENRHVLLPTREQMNQADDEVTRSRERYKSVLDILYVKSDYYDARPKPCMGGWAQRYLTVDPDGYVLPCPTARSIPNMEFANVREAPLRCIWSDSEAFQRFRGYEWMAEPCRSCELKTVDFGGCRCQAALITGDARDADPVCGLSKHRAWVDALLQDSESPAKLGDLRFRTAPRREG